MFLNSVPFQSFRPFEELFISLYHFCRNWSRRFCLITHFNYFTFIFETWLCHIYDKPQIFKIFSIQHIHGFLTSPSQYNLYINLYIFWLDVVSFTESNRFPNESMLDSRVWKSVLIHLSSSSSFKVQFHGFEGALDFV